MFNALALDTVERQASQTSPIFQIPARVLLDVSLTLLKSKKGSNYLMAASYTLTVPVAYPEALHVNLPEYPWAQGLQVALLALRLACNNATAYALMPLEQAVEQLHSFRRAYRLDVIPPSD